MMSNSGELFLIPTPLGENEPLEVLPLSVKKYVSELSIFICENEKTARAFLKKIGIRTPQDDLVFYVLNKYTEPEEIQTFLQDCENGAKVGLMSEAGFPAVADPGADIVMMAHRKGIKVTPLVGPSSIVLGLMSSGMNGQSFAFVGYLPIDKAERKKKIKDLEKMSRQLDQTQIFIETPYRNETLLESLIKTLNPNTLIGVACDLTLPTEYILTQTAQEWSAQPLPDLQKRPAIFLIQANNG